MEFRKCCKVLYFGLHAEKDWLQDAMEAKMDKERFSQISFNATVFISSS